MPALTTITVNDREATPVAHTFAPGMSNGTVQYFSTNTGVKIGDETLSISQRKVGVKYRPKIVLKVPTVVTETINGVSVPKVAREIVLELNCAFPEDSTQQERDNALGMFHNLLDASQTATNAVVADLEYWY